MDVEVATPITPYLALRAGVSIMPNFSLTTGVDVDVDVDASTSGLTIPNEIDVTGSLKRTTGQVLLNVYPFPRSSSEYLSTRTADSGHSVSGSPKGFKDGRNSPEMHGGGRQ